MKKYFVTETINGQVPYIFENISETEEKAIELVLGMLEDYGCEIDTNTIVEDLMEDGYTFFKGNCYTIQSIVI